MSVSRCTLNPHHPPANQTTSMFIITCQHLEGGNCSTKATFSSFTAHTTKLHQNLCMALSPLNSVSRPFCKKNTTKLLASSHHVFSTLLLDFQDFPDCLYREEYTLSLSRCTLNPHHPPANQTICMFIIALQTLEGGNCSTKATYLKRNIFSAFNICAWPCRR